MPAAGRSSASLQKSDSTFLFRNRNSKNRGDQDELNQRRRGDEPFGDSEQGAGMNKEFPDAVPEISVNNVDEASAYYENRFGFHKDWGDQEGGIGQVSKRNHSLNMQQTAR